MFFKMKNGLSPQYMRAHFIPQDGVHTYNTRLSSKVTFVIPKVKSHGLKSFCYNGCSLWNHMLLVKLQTCLILKLL